MPVVSTFDGVNRRIVLDASVAGGSWSPLDLYKEYLAYRRDVEQFRGFEPLIRMRGGEPKGGGIFAPRFLQMQTDSRGITTKLILPDTGPYRTRVEGELATDVADVDPEPFDISGLTTAVIVDYKPSEAEIIQVASQSDVDAIASAVWERALESAMSAEEMLRIILAATAGKASGAETTEMRFRSVADDKDRITATVDQYGNREAITLDGT